MVNESVPFPVAPDPLPPPPVPVVPPPPRGSRMSLRLLMIPLAAIILAAGWYGYRFYVLGQSVTIPVINKTLVPASPALQADASPTPVTAVSPVQDAESKLAYIRVPDANKPAEQEVWLIDPVTGEEDKLDLTGAASSYKHFGSPLLFYKKIADGQGTIRILDLSTGVDRAVTPITHPDPTVLESVAIQSVSDIAPDGKYFAFIADYYLVCPSPSPLPSGFEGGFGPCQPDQNLETPTGNYVYDLEEGKAHYLGSLDRISRWDTANAKLYYVSYEPYRNTNILDLKNKTISHLDTTEHFGYFTYPLLSRGLLVKNEAATAESGSTDKAFAEMRIVDLATKQSEVFDSVDEWAVIQPFISSPSDDRYVLYIRSTNINGFHRNAIYKYDVETKKVERLTPEDNTLSYSLQGEWIDNKTFVTAADPVEETDFNGTNKYLVRIDVETGKVDRLTPHNSVSYFGVY